MSRITVRAACPWRHFFVSVSLIPSFLCPVLLPQVAGCCVAVHGCWNGIAHKANVCLSLTPNSAMSCRRLKVMRMGAYVSAVGNVLQSDLNVDTLTHIYIYTLVISVSIARQLTGCITSEEVYKYKNKKEQLRYTHVNPTSFVGVNPKKPQCQQWMSKKET